MESNKQGGCRKLPCVVGTKCHHNDQQPGSYFRTAKKPKRVTTQVPSDGLSQFEIQEIHRSYNELYRGMPKAQKRAKKEAAVRKALAVRRGERQEHYLEITTGQRETVVQESPLLDLLENAIQELLVRGELEPSTTDTSAEIKPGTGVEVVAEQTTSNPQENEGSRFQYHRLRIPYPIGASSALTGIEMPNDHA